MRVGAVEQGAAAGDEIGRARRGGQHRHLVPEHPQLGREPGNVLVDVVRPRPGEWGDETDA
jgi:hypothetical protein